MHAFPQVPTNMLPVKGELQEKSQGADVRPDILGGVQVDFTAKLRHRGDAQFAATDQGKVGMGRLKDFFGLGQPGTLWGWCRTVGETRARYFPALPICFGLSSPLTSMVGYSAWTIFARQWARSVGEGWPRKQRSSATTRVCI